MQFTRPLFIIIVCGLLLVEPVVRAQEGPPTERGPFLKSDLVELNRLDPTLRLDIRYATANNFLGRPVYTEARAFLQRSAALALLRVHRKLRRKGYGLVIFDGYRPWSVTKIFWDATPEEKRAFVADPRKGSRHNRGCAVDLTLFDIKTGRLLPMPSDYDDFSERAHPDYQGGAAEERRNRNLLRAAMEAEGFTVYENEWWHFDYKDWKRYSILNMSFTEAAQQQSGQRD
ncbi:MAG: M15 family metallopeptidase [Acidobacteria bacterium]|nr:M15 family metallopeptidase [Acidobacteriota bacterium]